LQLKRRRRTTACWHRAADGGAERENLPIAAGRDHRRASGHQPTKRRLDGCGRPTDHRPLVQAKHSQFKWRVHKTKIEAIN
jgi:hypothetical protein